MAEWGGWSGAWWWVRVRGEDRRDSPLSFSSFLCVYLFFLHRPRVRAVRPAPLRSQPQQGWRRQARRERHLTHRSQWAAHRGCTFQYAARETPRRQPLAPLRQRCRDRGAVVQPRTAAHNAAAPECSAAPANQRFAHKSDGSFWPGNSPTVMFVLKTVYTEYSVNFPET